MRETIMRIAGVICIIAMLTGLGAALCILTEWVLAWHDPLVTIIALSIDCAILAYIVIAFWDD